MDQSPAEMPSTDGQENTGADPEPSSPGRREATSRGALNRMRAFERDRQIGQRMRFLRRLAGQSQQSIAEELGVSFQQVQKYESGSNRVSAALLAEVARLFSLPMEWFVGLLGETPAFPELTGARNWTGALDRLYASLNGSDEAALQRASDVILDTAGLPRNRFDNRLQAVCTALRLGFADSPQRLESAIEASVGASERIGGRQSPAARSPAGCHILLADDDPDVLSTLSTSLRNTGFIVETARNGDAALAILASGERIDLIITDYAMVGMDGVELLEQASLIRPELPGIIITGYSEAKRLQNVAPRVHIVRKPFRRMELLGRIRLLIEASAKGLSDPGAALN